MTIISVTTATNAAKTPITATAQSPKNCTVPTKKELMGIEPINSFAVRFVNAYGEIPIDVPQDRDGDFEPQIVPKRKKDISEIEQKIISLYAKGLSTRQISSVIDDIYTALK